MPLLESMAVNISMNIDQSKPAGAPIAEKSSSSPRPSPSEASYCQRGVETGAPAVHSRKGASVSTLLPQVSYRRIATPPIWIVALVGEHDLSTAPELGRILTEAVASGDPVVIDLQHATFADSSILGAIINARNHAERRGFAVVLPDDGEVRTVFELVDARAMLVTFPTLQRALQWCYPAMGLHTGVDELE
jgi:anti-anti-sigma factor